MRKLSLLTIFICSIKLSIGQDYYSGENPVLIISAGPTFQNIKGKSFNKFQDNYIDFYGDNIDKKRSLPGVGYYFQFNVMPFFNGEYTRHFSSKSILFKNGDKVDFKFKSFMYRLNVGYGIGDIDNDQMCIKPEIGFGVGNNILECDIETQNTNAKDLLLEGKYKDLNVILTLGLGIHLKPKSGPLGYKLYLRQNLSLTSNTMVADGKSALKDRIPIDYVAWRNTPHGDYLGESVKGNFRFFEIGLGLSLIFAN